MIPRIAFAAVALGLFLAAGCGPAKLNQTKTLTFDSKGAPAQSILLDAQPKPQTINVDFSSSEGEVRVLVFKESDAKGDDMASAADKLALGHKQGKASNFSVDVPANTAVAVVVRGATAAKTDVTVKLTNSK